MLPMRRQDQISSASPGETQHASTLKTIGHFELIERLGVGGFGTVWKARDTMLERTVAIKIPRKGALSEEETLQFLREAQAAAQLSHPNVVNVYEVGRDGEMVYIVTDYVRGVPLSEWITHHQPTVRESATICRALADALHHAHQSDVVHRDVKPGNILMDGDQQPHIMDFGLAKRSLSDVTMTVDGQVLGTPAYMSPEQARGDLRATDHRTDIYSLGSVLYQMITGEPPFRGNIRMLLHQVINEDPPPPRKLNNHVDRDLETICLKCLEKDPNRRYPSAQLLADELGRFVKGEPILARPIGPLARAVRWAQRSPLVASLVGTIMVTLLGGTLVSSWYAVHWRATSQELAKNKNELEEQTKALLIEQEENESLRLQEIANRQRLAERGEYNRQLSDIGEKDLRFDPESARRALLECNPSLRDFAWHLFNRYLCPPGATLVDQWTPITNLHSSRQGHWLVSESIGGHLAVYNTNNFRLAGELDLPTSDNEDRSQQTLLAISDSDPPRLAVVRAERMLYHRLLTDKSWSQPNPMEGVIRQGAFDQQGERLLLLQAPDDSPQGNLVWWDIDDQTTELQLGARCNRFALALDDSALAVQHQVVQEQDGSNPPAMASRIEVYEADRSTGKFNPVATLSQGETNPSECELLGIVFHNDSQNVYASTIPATARERPQRFLWDYRNDQRRTLALFLESRPPTIPPRGGPIIDWQFESRDGQSESHVRICDRTTLIPRALLNEHARPVEAIATGVSGTWVATADATGLVLIRNTTPLGERSFSHTSTTASAIHPLRSILATANIDNTVRLYHIDTGELIRELPGNQSRIETITFSPDGSRLATSNRNRTMHVWNIDWRHVDRTTTRQFRYEQSVRQIAFTAKPHELLALDEEGKVTVWDVDTPRITDQWTVNGGPVATMAVSRDGRHTALCDAAGTVLIHTSGQPIQLAVPEVEFTAAAFSHEAVSNEPVLLALSDTNRRIRFYELSDEGERPIGDFDIADTLNLSRNTRVSSLAFSPDKETLAVADRSGRVIFCDVETRALRAVMHAERAQELIEHVEFSANQSALVTQSAQGILRAWSIHENESPGKVLVGNLLLGNLRAGVAFFDDYHFAGPGRLVNAIFHWSLDGEQGPRMNVASGSQTPVCLATDAGYVSVGHADGTVSIADTTSGVPMLISSFKAHTGTAVTGICVANRGSRTVTTNGDEIKVWSPQPSSMVAQLISTIEIDHERYTALAASSRTGQLAIGTQSGELILTQLDHNAPRARLVTPNRGRIRQLAFSPRERLLACADSRQRIEVWDTAQQRKLHTLSGHVDTVMDLDFSPDGSLLVSASADGTIRIWSTENGLCEETIQAHEGSVTGVTCHPTGRGIVSIGTDRSIIYWDRTMGRKAEE